MCIPPHARACAFVRAHTRAHTHTHTQTHTHTHTHTHTQSNAQDIANGYEIHKEDQKSKLGFGSYSVVWKGKDRSTGTVCVCVWGESVCLSVGSYSVWKGKDRSTGTVCLFVCVGLSVCLSVRTRCERVRIVLLVRWARALYPSIYVSISIDTGVSVPATLSHTRAHWHVGRTLPMHLA